MSEIVSNGAAPVVPDPELAEQAKRREFTATYKLEILPGRTARGVGEIGECCDARACTPRT